MAGDWIKMRVDLADDPAVIEMAGRLSLDEFAVIGRLHVFWAWLDQQSRDGHARGVTVAWLDRKVQRNGFAAAMVAVGWLHLEEDGLTVPNFENHNGATGKARALASKRQQKHRAVVTPDATDESRPVRDASVTREEKRREEKPPTGVRASRRCPTSFLVTSELQQWAREEAPLVDIRAETAGFRDWEFPKAHADWPATWRGWMRREQKRLAEIAKRQKPADIARVTVPYTPPGPDSALEKMRRDQLTPEERAAADLVRRQVMSTIKPVKAAA